MKKVLLFLLDLIRAAVFSIRTGEGFIILHEENWLEQKKEYNILLRERALMWDCIDNMINGGNACIYCAYRDDPHCSPENGCDCWTLRNLTDEEVRDCEPRPTASAGEGNASV